MIGKPDDQVALAGTVEAGIHRLAARVYYADTDFSGAVYHARYLEFFERGRSDLLRLAGIHHTELAASEGGLFWVVRDMAIRFRAAARIDDVIIVETKIASVGGARISMRQTITRDGAVLAQADVEAALIDANGRAQRLPRAWRTAFEALAGAQS